MQLHGAGVVQNRAYATVLFARACAAGYVKGCEAQQAVESAVNAGNLDHSACLRGPGAVCEPGRTRTDVAIEKNLPSSETVTKLVQACEAQQPQACVELGALYMQGVGVPRDSHRAAAAWARACQRNVGSACFNLGMLYTLDQEMPTNAVKAAMLFAKACHLGDLAGCYKRALALSEGIGVSRDVATAHTLFDRACKGGIVLACR